MNSTGSVIGYLLFTILTILSLVAFAYLIYQRFLVLKLLKPINRLDKPGTRIAEVFKFFIGQKRILNSRFLDAGIMHAFIFWGFLVVFHSF